MKLQLLPASCPVYLSSPFCSGGNQVSSSFFCLYRFPAYLASKGARFLLPPCAFTASSLISHPSSSGSGDTGRSSMWGLPHFQLAAFDYVAILHMHEIELYIKLFYCDLSDTNLFILVESLKSSF